MRETYGPYDNVRVGTMLFTLVEPHRGHEVAYNRWYERDHRLAGCMVGPGWFAGRRWVATAADKALRFGTPGTFAADLTAGSYLATYWVQAGADAEAITWGSSEVRRLHESGRMFAERDHVHTLMYVHRFAVDRNDAIAPSALALDHPFSALGVLAVERAEDTDARVFSDWLADVALPLAQGVADSPLAKVIGFTPIPLPADAPVDQPPSPGERRRVLLLAFSGAEPEALAPALAALGDTLEHGAGAQAPPTVTYGAVFRPTVPGTDTYTDQLF